MTACEAWPLDRPLVDLLRADPFTPRLAPRLFEVPEIGGRLGVPGTSDAPPGATWPGALAALSTEGLLAREERLNACVARLLRGERPAALRAFLQVFTALDPSEDELAARTGDWVRLAIDAPSPVAGRAQGILTGLWQAGRLDARPLAEVSHGVLFRQEKTLVRAQLALLGKALARDPRHAGDLLAPLAEAFGHADAGIQECALKLAAHHLDLMTPDLRADLAEAAKSMGPGRVNRSSTCSPAGTT
ncbi:MAG: hypothetical protein JWR24_4366 [Actinoallomurus sp.]|nr:hypothetical protein [Actinoallomurus sp.]